MAPGAAGPETVYAKFLMVTVTAAATDDGALDAGIGDPVALAGALVDPEAADAGLVADFLLVELLHPAASRQAVRATTAGTVRALVRWIMRRPPRRGGFNAAE